MSSSTSPTKALCLLLVAIVVTFAHVGAAAAVAAAAKPLPGSCLMAASTLCSNADTNAMRCLRKLAIKGDARVPSACAEAIMAGVAIHPQGPQRNAASRVPRGKRMARLLTEGGGCNAGNNCFDTFGGVKHNQCNDALNGCSGCSQGTITFSASTTNVVSNSNPNNINCANICCKAANGNAACCISYSDGYVYCNNSSFSSFCSPATA